MAKPASRNSRAKGVERKVQQYLWPGTRFAGGAHRPAHEHEDVRGEDRDGRELWGEVKNWTPDLVQNGGGVWAVLVKAYHQCWDAILRAPHGPTSDEPRPFAVLWPVGSVKEAQRLVMYRFPVVGLAIVPLAEFKMQVIGGPTFSEEGETDDSD
jgi:hypothetical protein